MAVLPSHQRAQHGQIGVFVAYASRLGHALLDRELYVPEEWANDRERCRSAGIPDDRDFADQPANWPSRCWPGPSRLGCQRHG